MRILHTADWHLGKRLDRYSRLEEQIEVLTEINAIADEQQVDVVIVAGDLFDNFNPSTEAVELFYKTLKQLSKNGARPVIAIAGNHDSPNLIDAPDPLARASGIFLIGHPEAVINPIKLEHFEITKSAAGFFEITLNHFSYPIRIMHTAYANEIRLKQYLGENKADELNDLLAQKWQETADLYCDDSGVNILTTHLYMNKRGTPILEEPDGEKPIKIGNADLIYTDAIPNQIQYTALGHIHGHRNIGSTEKPIIYSSSPLCYSFSEAGQTKYVSIIDVSPSKIAAHQRIALTKGKPLFRKTFDNVLEAVDWLANNPHTLVELTLQTDSFLTSDERKLLFQSHEGIIYLIPVLKNMELLASTSLNIDLNQEMPSLFEDYFKSKNGGQSPNSEIMDLFNEILKS